MKHEPDSDTNLVTESAILAPQTAISVHERRKTQRKQRIQRAQRVLLKLLAGVGPSRIAEEEHISRSTVWRYRRHKSLTGRGAAQKLEVAPVGTRIAARLIDCWLIGVTLVAGWGLGVHLARA